MYVIVVYDVDCVIFFEGDVDCVILWLCLDFFLC